MFFQSFSSIDYDYAFHPGQLGFQPMVQGPKRVPAFSVYQLLSHSTTRLQIRQDAVLVFNHQHKWKSNLIPVLAFSQFGVPGRASDKQLGFSNQCLLHKFIRSSHLVCEKRNQRAGGSSWLFLGFPFFFFSPPPVKSPSAQHKIKQTKVRLCLYNGLKIKMRVSSPTGTVSISICILC